jgi:hypothetical protein
MKIRPFSWLASKLAVALWLIITWTASAQPGVPLWTNRYNGPGAAAMAVDGNDNVVVTGVFYYYDTNSSSYVSDYGTIKFSGAGAPLWTNRYNGPANSYGEPVAVAVGKSGNVVVTGSSVGSGSGWDYVTIEYSDTGVPLWTNRYNGPANSSDYAHGVAVDSSGNVVVVGESVGVNEWANDDYATIKYSATGAPLWTNRYSGPGDPYDGATAVAVDGGGNVIVTGYSESGSGYIDYVTFKYSAAGVPLWTNHYDGPAHDVDQPTAVAVDGSDNVFVSGYSYDDRGYGDYATVKYSPSGEELWARRYDGPLQSEDEVTGIAVDGSGNVIVTGYSDVSHTGAVEYDTIKYSGAGVPLWTNSFGPGYINARPAIALDRSGNVFVKGMFSTVAYSGAGVPLWTNNWPGPPGEATALAVDGSGNVFVAGTWGSDCATIKYSGATLSPILLNYQILGNQLVLSWTNAAFNLQSALGVEGAYTNIPGATSPFTNLISVPQQYFRLKAN